MRFSIFSFVGFAFSVLGAGAPSDPGAGSNPPFPPGAAFPINAPGPLPENADESMLSMEKEAHLARAALQVLRLAHTLCADAAGCEAVLHAATAAAAEGAGSSLGGAGQRSDGGGRGAGRGAALLHQLLVGVRRVGLAHLL